MHTQSTCRSAGLPCIVAAHCMPTVARRAFTARVTLGAVRCLGGGGGGGITATKQAYMYGPARAKMHCR